MVIGIIGGGASGMAAALAAAKQKNGKVATFFIRVLFRQNASWQGSVFWHEGKQEERFRSVLELLLLINSALSLEKL